MVGAKANLGDETIAVLLIAEKTDKVLGGSNTHTWLNVWCVRVVADS